ncbi:MAG: DUF1016 N-terminal domain-containing protein [Candidatus Omnitrophota bacterium]|jgi:endonuclease YncB( thermonuclease family)
MNTVSVATYAALRKKVEETLLLGRQRIEEAKVRTYWETGRLINEYLQRSENPNQEHGKKIVANLAKDLGFGETVFYRCMRFAEKFPTLAARPKLTWAHYRALITVPDEKKRLALEDKAAKGEWSSRDFEIDTGFDDQKHETIRLKGIDCPEFSGDSATKKADPSLNRRTIQGGEGRAAKRFVERELAHCESIILKSARTQRKEKWGRYLGDVFYVDKTGKQIYLNNLLLEKGYAVRVRD